MEKILWKIGLIKKFELQLQAKREEFVHAFQDDVDRSELTLGHMLNSSIFSNTRNRKFEGLVGYRGFKVRKVKTSFAPESVIASGSFEDINGTFLISGETNPFNGLAKILSIFFIFFAIIFTSIMLSVPSGRNTMELIQSIIMILAASTTIPYVMMYMASISLKKSLLKYFRELV